MERERLHVERSPTRCPYCHDDVAERDVERALVCLRCLARHHADCWEGRCAACGAERALTPTAAPAARRARRARGDATAGFERANRWVNRGFIASFVLAVALHFLALAGGPLPEPGQGELPPRFLPVAFVLFETASLGIASTVIGMLDAHERRRREPSLGWAPFLVALAGLATGGFAAFAYYLRWGHAPRARPRAGDDAKDELQLLR